MQNVHKPLPLAKGAIVHVIAPASACPKTELEAARQLLLDWHLVPQISPDIFGKDLLCANTDEQRFEQLAEALCHVDSAAVWCLRGGYGSTRLLPGLAKLTPPTKQKLFIGYSDITLLHTFLQQSWGWCTLHGPSVRQVGLKEVPEENIKQVKNLLFGVQAHAELTSLAPMNDAARAPVKLTSMVTGGNLSLVQTTIGTPHQLQTKHKIVLLEDIGERGYQVDRILAHLQQAGLFKDVAAVIFGDFTQGKEPDGSCLIEPVLTRFANQCSFPVLRCQGVGHGSVNHPVPFGTSATLSLGEAPRLVMENVC